MNPPDDLLSRKEAVEQFRVTENTLRAWEAAGRLPVIRLLTGHHRYRRADVEALVVQAAAPPEPTLEATPQPVPVLTRLDERRAALDVLHAIDVSEGDVTMDLAALPTFSRGLVQGVAANTVQIDALIEAASTRWTMDRMPVVDRNVLRLAVYELLHTKTPTGPIVDQAVTMAKLLSTEGSGRFVNGILGRIAREHR